MSPLDFGIWGYMGASLAGYRGAQEISHECELRAALLAIRASLPQSMVDNSVDSLATRVAALGNAAGRHFEHTKTKGIKRTNQRFPNSGTFKSLIPDPRTEN